MKTNCLNSNNAGLVLAAVAALAGLCLTAHAAKPVKPPPPPPPVQVDVGRMIYDNYTANPAQIWSMNPDGTGKALLGDQVLPPAEPSRKLHNGQRWFLGWQRLDGLYPDGYQRYGLCAFSQNGVVVVLAVDPALEPNLINQTDDYVWTPNTAARWATRDGIADGRVSFLGRRYPAGAQGAADATDIGLYVVDFDPETLGVNFQAPPTQFLMPLPLIVTNPEDFPLPYGNIPPWWGMDWSPDGTRFVYGWHNQLVVTAVADGSAAAFEVTAAPGEAWLPRWSPTGSEILFLTGNASSGHLDAIRPDGSGLRTVVPAPETAGQPGWVAQDMIRSQFSWSPHGTHVVFGLHQLKGQEHILSIWRAAADGTGITKISGKDTSVAPLGWL